MKKNIEFIARGFIVKNNKMLLCKRKDRDYYFFPGGHVEFGEFAKDALIREIKEEIGAEVINCDFIGIAENVFKDNDKQLHEVNFVFQTEISETKADALEDHLEFRWINTDEISKTEVLPTSLKEKFFEWNKDKKIFWSSQNDLKNNGISDSFNL